MDEVKNLAMIVLLVAITWLSIGASLFLARHPCANQLSILAYIDSVVLFEKEEGLCR